MSTSVAKRSTFIRICAVGAILAGILRAITSFIPEHTPRIRLLYLVIDLCLLMAVIGLYRFAATGAMLFSLLGSLVMVVALLILIARDLGIAPGSVYAGAAAVFSVGLILFAIHAVKTKRIPIWIPIAWFLSTILGPVGFSQLQFLFAISGLIFGIAFAAAGLVMWAHVSKTQ